MPLFKYTSHFGVKILQNLQLKVTPPNELNDPFEVSPCLLPESVTEQHVREVLWSIPARDLYDALVQGGEKLPPLEQCEAHIHSTYLANVARAIPDFQRIYEERILGNLDLVSKRHGIVCFSKKENDILLWSHYTDSHRGMLLEFDTTHSYFTDNSRFLQVCYSPSRVPWNPTWPEDGLEMEEYVKKVLCTKNSPWQYEQEWRSLHLLDTCHTVLVGKSPSHALYFTDIPGEIIQRVVLGLRCPADMQRQVEEARAERKLKFALCRAVLHPTEFKVEYKPI